MFAETLGVGMTETPYDVGRILDSRSLSQSVVKSLTVVTLVVIPFYEVTWLSNITHFRCTEGGILAHFAIRFTKKGKGHMNIFSQAVQAGKIGELEVQPSYIEVSK